MDRTERPTENRIEELRAMGLVPYSPFSVRASGTVCALLSIFMLRENAEKLLALVPIEDPLRTEQIAAIWRELFPLLFFPTAMYFAGASLAGLLQTRFLIRPGAFSLDLGRLMPRGSPFAPLRRLAAAVLAVFFAGLLGAAAFRFSLSDIYSLFNNRREFAAGWLPRFFEGMLPILGALLLGGALAAWLLGRIIFYRAHRMSRNEIEQEARSL